MPRSEPPRKVGMNRPLMWLGIGYAPIFFSSDFGAAPPAGLKTYGHSQPLPMNEAIRPLANGMLGNGCASSCVLLARESFSTIDLKIVSAFTACGESTVPFHLPFLPRTASCPPQSSMKDVATYQF